MKGAGLPAVAIGTLRDAGGHFYGARRRRQAMSPPPPATSTTSPAPTTAGTGEPVEGRCPDDDGITSTTFGCPRRSVEIVVLVTSDGAAALAVGVVVVAVPATVDIP